MKKVLQVNEQIMSIKDLSELWDVNEIRLNSEISRLLPNKTKYIDYQDYCILKKDYYKIKYYKGEI